MGNSYVAGEENFDQPVNFGKKGEPYYRLRLMPDGSILTGDGQSAPTPVSGTGVPDHGTLTGLGDDDHTQYRLKSALIAIADLAFDPATQAELDAEVTARISADSNHVGAADPHGMYRLESAPIQLGDLGFDPATQVELDAEVLNRTNADTSHAGAADPHAGYRLESAPIQLGDLGFDPATQGELDGAVAGLVDYVPPAWEVSAVDRWAIVGNRAKRAGGTVAHHQAWITGQDYGTTARPVTVSAVVHNPGNGVGGLVGRLAASGADHYYAEVGTARTVRLYKRVASVYTTIGGVSTATVADGDKLSLRCADSELAILINDVVAVTVVDTTFPNPAGFGLSGAHNGTNDIAFDNFRLEGLSVGRQILTDSFNRPDGPLGSIENSFNSLNKLAGAAVLRSLADAKGDLLVATGNDVVGRLAAGTNGQVLTADSAVAAGVKWAAAAGGGGAVGPIITSRTVLNQVESPTPEGWLAVPGLPAISVSLVAGQKMLIEYSCNVVKGTANNYLFFTTYIDGARMQVGDFGSVAHGGGASQNASYMQEFTAPSTGNFSVETRRAPTVGTSSSDYKSQTQKITVLPV